jgi:hypothetical protein
MQAPSLCQHCGKRFPAIHQYRNCDECGQPIAYFQAAAPMGVAASAPSLDSPTVGSTSALTILIFGIISIIAIALIVFVATNIFSGGSSETSDIGLPTAKFIGMDVVGGTPAKVNYLILRVSNPLPQKAFSISESDLTIVYQDASGNLEEVSYPGMETGVGLIADARDKESIDACSKLASQSNNIAIWCSVNDGTNTSILPGMSGDIYVFLGGLTIPLRENVDFSIDLITSTTEIVITANGTTPRVFKLPTVTNTPAPTVQLVVTPMVVTPTETPIPPTTTPLLAPPRLPAIVLTPLPTATAPAPAPTSQPQPSPTPKPVALLPLPAANNRILPHVFVGEARINGKFAPLGTKVTAWADGYDAPVGLSDVKSNGLFALTANQHGTILQSGQTLLSFKIGGKDTVQTRKWVEGGGTQDVLLETN